MPTRHTRPNQKHPHVCGEDIVGICLFAMMAETPPRVWGRHVLGLAGPRKKRNTPTCVGKTWKQACAKN